MVEAIVRAPGCRDVNHVTCCLHPSLGPGRLPVVSPTGVRSINDARLVQPACLADTSTGAACRCFHHTACRWHRLIRQPGRATARRQAGRPNRHRRASRHRARRRRQLADRRGNHLERISAAVAARLRRPETAAREVGGCQVQNFGTVGGNLCNASPAADGVPPLLALDAAVELCCAAGTRTMPLEEFITGPRRTARRLANC